ncbi:hypothetical protein DYB25_008656 [Aphanomyces astaci]|uniref:Ciliary BBSome complex subunit 2 middle region domain-containing protein n=2 Tax=Aphanomyces astaci TaxID=112090 RepID=A0A397BEA8_APHAT|nr:hypothetical protein DYB25_008656 [Aphanomyces astaci]RHY48148.1 hypothetical protein DYB30_011554 [Aphanomyces astaci]RHY49170.1 hypothetical protein DYB34_009472 [Aphanomyces astaci]
MSLTLNHAELFKVGAISSRATLKLLPLSKKKKKVGTDITLIMYPHAIRIAVYKSNAHANPITCITLGNFKGTEDRAYVSSGQQVVGYNKKGKEFFKFPTNLSETINRVHSYDSKLGCAHVLATDYIYNQFENGVDKETSMCQDRIHDLLLHQEADSNEFHAVLGCQDKYIRVMRGNVVLAKKATSGAVTTLTSMGSKILYGTAGGTFGLVMLTNGGKLKTVWKTAQDKAAPSPITSMVTYDINKDGAAEVVDMEDSYGRSRGTVQRETRIVKLRKEIAILEEKVLKEKEKSSRKGDECLPVVEEVPVNCQCVLNPDNQTYDIAVRVTDISFCVPLDLLDTAKNQAILCRSPTTNSHVLATYRCQELTNRLEFRIRTLEGQYGDVELTVLAETVPKAAQCVKVVVKPLSLHHRVNVVDSADVDESVMNSLHFTGAFSLIQVHEWVCFCLPDVPVRMQDDEGKLFFRNAFVGNILVCEYKKGEARFLSSSVSAIAILKEVITKEATARKVTLNMTFDIKNESTAVVLALLRPKLDEKQMLASQVKILDGIKRILADADRIVAAFDAHPRAMTYLTGVLTDLYVDISKFRGVNPKTHLPRLFHLLDQYNFDALVEFFTRAP